MAMFTHIILCLLIAKPCITNVLFNIDKYNVTKLEKTDDGTFAGVEPVKKFPFYTQNVSRVYVSNKLNVLYFLQPPHQERKRRRGVLVFN